MIKFSVLILSIALAFSLTVFLPACNDDNNDNDKDEACCKMISVPSGTFQRDATAGNTSTVSAFLMSEKEITRAQFTEVTGLPDPSEIVYPLNPGPNTPVQMVSWYHALIFCNMMSIAEGRTPVYTISGSTDPADWGTVPVDIDYAEIPYPTYWSDYHPNLNWDTAAANWSADGYRLPTEAEWMWAALGAAGGTTGYLKTFAGSTGSNAIEDFAWTLENSLQTTQPVGTKLPNELGLYDMSGNVFEWCWDWYDVYPAGSLTDYTGPASAPAGNTHRVSRGGSWQCVKSYAAVADRSCSTKTCHGHHNIGFRISRRP